MEYSSVEARARRNRLDELAGENYRDKCSDIVSKLKNEGKYPYLGIQNDDGCYTIVGQNCCYIMTDQGVSMEIAHDKFLNILRENAMKLGKQANFEYVSIDENGAAWLKDGQTMNAMWGLVQFINRPR